MFTPKLQDYLDQPAGFRFPAPHTHTSWSSEEIRIGTPNPDNHTWAHLYIETAVKYGPYERTVASYGVSEKPATHRVIHGKLPDKLNPTDHTAVCLAVLRAIELVPPNTNIKISTSSKHIRDTLTSKLMHYEDMNWVNHDVDAPLLRMLVARLRERPGLTTIKTYTPTSDRDLRERARDLAKRALLHPPEDSDGALSDLNDNMLVYGAKLVKLTQSQIYKVLLAQKAANTPTRPSTKTHLELASAACGERLGYMPSPKEIWKSIRSKNIAHKKIRAFLWRVMHNALPCGRVWPNDPHPERALCPTCQVRETPQHILLECPDNGQETVWNEARTTLERKGITLPVALDIGTILTCGLPAKRNATPGENRLFTVVIAEASWLIWARRCKWIMEDEGKPEKRVSAPEARNTWRKRINSTLTFELLASNEKKYKKKALDPTLVYDTWTGVVDSEEKLKISLSTHRNSGVLVGSDFDRGRPPGQPG
ncbi:hypothetical protein DFP72DRAFT_815066 [Ephemerocybe angulata]|uniref:Reverse transcriptase zinc-binding domain-containing protein n=1 Tax=Ephemerocybe angulata TaxID=980116 RepID=A0A8H6M4C1_9AGAR|nr:hypothetical protein DFP72DRAFT_815066 [Tulosesus angulatus]